MEVSCKRIVVRTWPVERDFELAEVVPADTELLLRVAVLRANNPKLAALPFRAQPILHAIGEQCFRHKLVTANIRLTKSASCCDHPVPGRAAEDRLLRRVGFVPEGLIHDPRVEGGRSHVPSLLRQTAPPGWGRRGCLDWRDSLPAA